MNLDQVGTLDLSCRFPGCTRKSQPFKRKSDLERHKLKHSNNTRWYCGDCQNKDQKGAFKRKDHLVTHLRSIHQLPNHVKPTPCGSEPCVLFSNELSLDYHIRRQHSEEGIYVNDASVSRLLTPEDSTSPGDSPIVEEAGRHDEAYTYNGLGIEMAGGKHRIQQTPHLPAKRGKSRHTPNVPEAVLPAPPGPSEMSKFLSANFSPDPSPNSSGSARFGSSCSNSAYISDGIGFPNIIRFPNLPSSDSPKLPESDFDYLWDLETQSTSPVSDILNYKEIHNVHSADFLALTSLDSVQEAQQALKDSAPNARDKDGRPTDGGIIFNALTRTVKLQGSDIATTHAKEQIEKSLQELLRHTSAKDEQNTTNCFHYAPKHFDRLNEKGLRCKGLDASTQNIFPIRAIEDSQLIDTWTMHILPQLAGILKPNVGGDYSAALVRQGISESCSTAVIRVQSANGQSQQIRTIIRNEINRICEANNQQHIRIQFSEGQMMLLAHCSARESAQEMAEIEDDKENDRKGFPHHRRYWKYAGMGASIGLICNKSVSATLGGYILVDQKRFLLTVDHFIGESVLTQSIMQPTGQGLLDLSSPSLSDVGNMRARVEQTLKEMRAEIEEVMQIASAEGQQISVDPAEALEILRAEQDSFLKFWKELQSENKKFALGKILYRCAPERRESPTSSRILNSNTPIFHRTDWSLSEIDRSRTGDNRHRYRFDPQSDEVDFLGEGTNPKGAGQLCTGTCDVEKNASVHYVGQRSGRLSARVNAVPMLNSCGGLEFHEWTLLPSEQKHSVQTYAGDSGAWIIRDSDTKLMGMLWGWKDNQLFFTPIADVFEAIQENTGATDICLPGGSTALSGSAHLAYNRSPEIPETTSYAYVRPTRFRVNMPNKPSRTVVMPERVKTDLTTPPHQLGATVAVEKRCPNEMELSPVPSLSTSITSSCKSVTRSPSCHLSGIEIQGKKLFSTESKHQIVLEPHVVMREGSESDGDLLDSELDLYISSRHDLTDDPPNNERRKDKHSIDFILVNTSEHRQSWPSSVTPGMCQGLNSYQAKTCSV